MSGNGKRQRLQWHPAFGAALRITFAEEIERKELELQEEYLLSKKPPQIDVLIIKKLRDVSIHKTSGRIFRKHNEENCWLQSLRMNLRAGKELSGLITKYEPYKDSKDHAAVMDLITRANWKEMEVEEKMCDALRELFADEMEKEREKARRTGRQEGLEEGHAQGRAQGFEQGIELAKLIFRLSSEGRSEEEIAGKCGIPLERVREVLE